MTDRQVDVFFVPMPDAIPMPRNFVTHFQYDDRQTPYVAGAAIDVSPVDYLRQHGGPLDVVIRYSHVPTAPSDVTLSMAAAVAVSEYVTGVADDIQPVDPADLIKRSGGGPRTTRVITIAEVAAFTGGEDADHESKDIEIENLSDPFLRALQCVQHFVRALRLRTGTPIAVPTYQRIGPSVLVSRQVHPQDGYKWEHYVQSLNQEVIGGKPPGVLAPEAIAAWLQAVQLLSAGDVRALVEETAADAYDLVARTGDYAGSILKAAQAAEVLLDGLLGLLLWEDRGGAPGRDGDIEGAADVLRTDLRPRIRSAYHPLLGGQWDLGQPGALADWHGLVAEPRNRIVHRGYRPRAAEAAEALNTLRALDRHLMRLLAGRARRFPRTALMLIGEDGLRREGAWSRIRAFSRDAASSEPVWRDNYAYWRDNVDRLASARARR